jgi:hypothetical protein
LKHADLRPPLPTLADVADKAGKIQRRVSSRPQKPWLFDNRGVKRTAKNSERQQRKNSEYIEKAKEDDKSPAS